jgi:(1->4)-alpha-D-glucan 1-alpha-D-glucosylmutase
MLASFAARSDEPAALLAELLENAADGRIKLYVTWLLLQLRRGCSETFLDGAYRELPVSGAGAESLVAFARGDIAFIAPRLIRRRLRPGLQLAFDDERVALGAPNITYQSILDGRSLTTDNDGTLAVRELFALAPLAVLTPRA